MISLLYSNLLENLMCINPGDCVSYLERNLTFFDTKWNYYQNDSNELMIRVIF